MATTLHTKHRPAVFADVVGQKDIVESVQEVLDNDSSHAFIFTGPSGCGKTTIARLIADYVGCDQRNRREIDAATNSGVDAMRDITATMSYAGLGESPVRVLIVDEAHSLSKAAWQSLLKGVEEPPAHVYWIFCTTEANKIPNTIKTRCSVYNVQPVKRDDIFDLIEWIANEEDFDTSDDVLELIADKAEGSPRRAITMLSICKSATSRKVAASLIQDVGDEAEIVELCRLLAQGSSDWKKAMKILAPHVSSEAEGIRRQIVAYFTKVAMSAKTADSAAPALAVLDAFNEPCPQGSGITPILVGLGELMVD